MEIEEIKKEVAKILKAELPSEGYNAFFFGSRVTGTASATSDLDVGIESIGQTKYAVPEDIMRNIKAGIEAIETLYSIDVVDFCFISEDFRKVAKIKIEPIQLS